jgi:predicted Zn finger-like uncharacterized protein
MIVTCEDCGTSYKVSSSQIRPSGSKVRCSKCQHVFIAYPPLQEPGYEKSSQDKKETFVSEADYSNVNTSTFLADAAETEKQLDAFFAEDFESETDFDTGHESSSLDPGQGQFREPEVDDKSEDFFDFDFQDLSTEDSEQILMKDLEYDEELSFSDLEADADLDISELERPAADLDISDLEKSTADIDISELGFDKEPDFQETDEPADLELSDLEAEAGTNLADLEEEDFDISDLEFDDDQMISEGEGSADDFSLDTMQETFDLDLNSSLDSNQQDQKPAFGELAENFSKATMGLPDFETEADLDLSDLEKQTADIDISELEKDTADLDISDLESDVVFEELESEQSAELDFSDLEVSDIEEETESEFKANIDLSGFEDEDGSAASEIMEYDEESLIEIQEQEPESEPEVFDFHTKEDGQDASGLMESQESVEEPEDILEGQDNDDVIFEQLDEEFDLDFNDSETPEPEHQDDIVKSDQDLFDSFSDSEEDSFSDDDDVIEEQEVSLETVHEEFDLDLDTFELNIDDEDGYLDDQDYDPDSEISGKKETYTGIADMENDDKKQGKTEDLFELDLDLDLFDSTEDFGSKEATEDILDLDFGIQESEETQQSDAGASKKPDPTAETGFEDKTASGQGVYEVNLELGQDEEEDEDFLLDLDLDFDETPDEQILAEKEEQSPTEPPLDLATQPEDTEISAKEIESEKDTEEESDSGLELDLELEDSGFDAQESDTQIDEKQSVSKAIQPETGVDSDQDTDLDLDLDLDLEQDLESDSSEDDDFELDLETMFEDSDESEDSKEVLLESADGLSDQMEPSRQQEPESGLIQEDQQVRKDSVMFPGVTDGTEDSGQVGPDEDVYDDEATIFEKAVPPQALTPGSGKKRKWAVAAVIIILVAAVGIGAYFYFYGFGKSRPDTADPGNLRIAVSDPSYRFIDNQQAGELLVVTGSVTNRYGHSRKNILVQGGLHDEQGRMLEQSSAVCGNTLLPEQLQNFEIDKIRQILGQKAGEEYKIPIAGPGGSLPFMMVFPDPPEGIAELSVKPLSSEKNQ